MSRFCRDCQFARVTGLSLGEPACRCERGYWGAEAWAVALVAPACGDFQPAAEEPDTLEFWGLTGGFGLEPLPRRRRRAHAEDLQHLLAPATA